MSVIEGFTESSGRNVRVHLRCRQRLVAQEFLNASEIGSGVEQVGGKRVSQGVGADLRVQSRFFQIMCERAHGTRAIRSDRRQKHRIDLVLFQKPGNLADQRRHFGKIGRYHDRVMIIGHGTDDLSAQSFNRKDQVQVLLISRSVKIHRNMAHDDVFRRRVTMEDAVIRIPSGKRSIFAQLQAGRRN